MSNIDELLKYKELLENKAITEEEFEKVKIKLLNINTISKETKFCQFCGKKVPKDSKVCIYCGKRLEEVKAEEVKKLKKNTMSTKKIVLIILSCICLALLFIGIIVAQISLMFNGFKNSQSNNTIVLVDGEAGQYGIYDEDLLGYDYYLPTGTYKIVSYKDNNPNTIDTFNAIVWKNDGTEYSKSGKQYRKSAKDEKLYTTKLPDTFTISEKEYIYIPLDFTITLEIIEN